MRSSFDVKSLELLLKVGGHNFHFFEEDFFNNMNDLMWLIPINSAAIHINEYQQLYDHLLTIGQLDKCMSNVSMAYKLASSFTAMKYKKKMGKKTKLTYIEKYTNILK